MTRNSKWEELARRLAERTQELRGQSQPVRPALRIVEHGQKPTMDALTRESHLKMVGHLRRRWGRPMQELIDQACFGVVGPEHLGDEDLVALHRDLERAQECMRDGVTFEDAGLLRSRYG